MGAGAWRVHERGGTTAAGAWGCPAHRRLKVQPPLLLDAPQQRPARSPQAEHVSAASARGREVDVLGAHSARNFTISSILLGAGSGARSRLERANAASVSDPVREVNATHLLLVFNPTGDRAEPAVMLPARGSARDKGKEERK